MIRLQRLSRADINRCIAEVIENNTNPAVLVLNPDKTLAYCSPGALQLTGCRLLLFQDITTLFPPASTLYLQNILQNANHHPNKNHTHTILTNCHANPRPMEIVVHAHRNELELKAYTLLLNNNGIKNHLVEGINSVEDYAIFIIDHNGIILSWNQGAERIKGYTAQEALGRSIEMFYPSDSPAERQQMMLTVLQEAKSPGGYHREERRFRRVKVQYGSFTTQAFLASIVITPIYNQDNSLYGYLKVVRDITQKRQLEQKLQETLANINLIFENFNIGNWEWYLNPEQIIWHGGQTLRLYGKTEQDFKPLQPGGKSFLIPREKFSQMVEQQTFEKAKQQTDASLAVSEPKPYQIQYDVIWPDNSSHTIITRGQIFKDAMGKPYKLAGISWDDTERATLQQAELAQAKALEKQASLQRKEQSDFTSYMSHEVRAGLQGLLAVGTNFMPRDLAALQRLLANIALNTMDLRTSDSRSVADLLESLQLNLNIIQLSANHLQGLTTQALSLSKLQYQKAIDPVLCTLGDIIDPVAQMMKPLVEQKKLSLIVAAYPLKQELKIDKERFKQLLINLIGNSAKFTAQGSITLDCKTSPRSNGGLQVLIKVIDTGIGMTREQADKLFQPYVQATKETSSQYGGTGLGLVICHEIVTQMGGEIRIESVPEKGSTFQVTVFSEPITQADRQPPSPPSPFPQAAELPANNPLVTQGRLRIMVVDDNVVNQRVLQRFLTALGYEFQSVGDGSQAVQLYKEQHLSFEAILMDTQMSVMDGLEATRQIREFENKFGLVRTPIISISGNADKTSITAIFEAGMDAVVTKPFKQDLLGKELDTVIQKQAQSVVGTLPTISHSLERLNSSVG